MTAYGRKSAVSYHHSLARRDGRHPSTGACHRIARVLVISTAGGTPPALAVDCCDLACVLKWYREVGRPIRRRPYPLSCAANRSLCEEPAVHADVRPCGVNRELSRASAASRPLSVACWYQLVLPARARLACLTAYSVGPLQPRRGPLGGGRVSTSGRVVPEGCRSFARRLLSRSRWLGGAPSLRAMPCPPCHAPFRGVAGSPCAAFFALCVGLPLWFARCACGCGYDGFALGWPRGTPCAVGGGLLARSCLLSRRHSSYPWRLLLRSGGDWPPGRSRGDAQRTFQNRHDAFTRCLRLSHCAHAWRHSLRKGGGHVSLVVVDVAVAVLIAVCPTHVWRHSPRYLAGAMLACSCTILKASARPSFVRACEICGHILPTHREGVLGLAGCRLAFTAVTMSCRALLAPPPTR